MDFKSHLENLEREDKEVYEFILKEIDRQKNTIELIPSENIVSPSVMEAQGSILTNKYSEGLPGKRYYGGNQFIDEIENLAIDRAKKLFGAEFVNVQAHSGSSANMAAYMSLVNLEDKILSINLSQGGHLTHGHHINFSGMNYNFIHYELDEETHLINYEKLREIALREKPKLIVTGFSAYPREVDFRKFKEIADEVGAYILADISHIAGLVVAGIHQNPVPFCDIVTTTTHKTLRGPRGAIIMGKKEFADKINRAVFPGIQGGPLEHIIAAKAVAFGEALKPEFVEYQKNVVKNNKAIANALIDNDIKIVSGGTDNHLILIDLRNKNISGKEAESILDDVGLCANKNMIPFDTASPFNPSGLRIGSPVITSRGFSEEDSYKVGKLISEVIKDSKNNEVLERVRTEVKSLCEKYPIYEN